MGSLIEVRPRVAALFFVALAGATVLLGLAGCGSKPVASVNGDGLSEQEFLRRVEHARPDRLSPQQGSVGKQVLMGWIMTAMLAQEARRLKVYPTDKEVDARIATLEKSASQAGGLDAALLQQGMTREAFRQDVLDQLVQENVVFHGIAVSDDEVRKFYEAQKPQMTQPEQVRISQITVDSEDAMKQAQQELASPTAQFALVATSRSKDEFAQQGGVVPTALPRQVPAGLPVSQQAVDAAFKLKEGEISKPVKVGSTWVFVKLEQKIAEKAPTFEEVSEQIRMELKRQKIRNSPNASEMQKRIQEMSRTAKIEINRPEYANIKQMIASEQAGPGGAPTGPAGPGGAMPGGE
jgi:foldase protein PrsA